MNKNQQHDDIHFNEFGGCACECEECYDGIRCICPECKSLYDSY